MPEVMLDKLESYIGHGWKVQYMGNMKDSRDKYRLEPGKLVDTNLLKVLD